MLQIKRFNDTRTGSETFPAQKHLNNWLKLQNEEDIVKVTIQDSTIWVLYRSGERDDQYSTPER